MPVHARKKSSRTSAHRRSLTLADLKQLVTERAPAPTTPTVSHTKKVIAPQQEQEIDFRRLMQAQRVIPLPAPARVVHKRVRPAPIPCQRLRDEREVLELAKYGEALSLFEYEIGQEWDEDQTYIRHGVSPDVLRKLRRGFWAIQSELDLHGLTTHEAHDAVLDFLMNARQRGLRCLRIVHGKGLSSPDKLPVLKGKVRRWLIQWNEVLAYCEPLHNGGGGGAVLVLLKGSR